MVNCGVLYNNTTEHTVGMIYIRIPVPNGSGEMEIAPKMTDQKAICSLVSQVRTATIQNMIPARYRILSISQMTSVFIQ